MNNFDFNKELLQIENDIRFEKLKFSVNKSISNALSNFGDVKKGDKIFISHNKFNLYSGYEIGECVAEPGEIDENPRFIYSKAIYKSVIFNNHVGNINMDMVGIGNYSLPYSKRDDILYGQDFNGNDNTLKLLLVNSNAAILCKKIHELCYIPAIGELTKIIEYIQSPKFLNILSKYTDINDGNIDIWSSTKFNTLCTCYINPSWLYRLGNYMPDIAEAIIIPFIKVW